MLAQGFPEAMLGISKVINWTVLCSVNIQQVKTGMEMFLIRGFNVG